MGTVVQKKPPQAWAAETLSTKDNDRENKHFVCIIPSYQKTCLVRPSSSASIHFRNTAPERANSSR